MKNEIEQAGFKSQKELSKQIGITEATLSKWMKTPPMLFQKYIWAKIELANERKKNIRLEKYINDRLVCQ